MSENIEKFCDTKTVSYNMRSAFYAYIRTSYARKFYMNNGETVKLIVSKMNEAEIEEAWVDFVAEFKRYLDSTKEEFP